MKNEQHQQAKHLYFQTNLSKTEIADLLKVNRRSVMLWAQQGNWDRLRQSAENMPSAVAEKAYFVLDHYLSHILTMPVTMSTFGPQEAGAINQMATAIKKVRNRMAVNESMEMLNFFLEFIRKSDPEKMPVVRPLIEQYIAQRSGTGFDQFLPKGFNQQGLVDLDEKKIREDWADQAEWDLIRKEEEEQLSAAEAQRAKEAEPSALNAVSVMVSPVEPPALNAESVTATEAPVPNAFGKAASRELNAEPTTNTKPNNDNDEYDLPTFHTQPTDPIAPTSTTNTPTPGAAPATKPDLSEMPAFDLASKEALNALPVTARHEAASREHNLALNALNVMVSPAKPLALNAFNVIVPAPILSESPVILNSSKDEPPHTNTAQDVEDNAIIDGILSTWRKYKDPRKKAKKQQEKESLERWNSFASLMKSLNLAPNPSEPELSDRYISVLSAAEASAKEAPRIHELPKVHPAEETTHTIYQQLKTHLKTMKAA